MVGIPRPIGTKTNGASRFSTRDANLKMGLPLEERFKTGSDYVPVNHVVACDGTSVSTNSSPNKTKKKKRPHKVDV